MKNIVSFIIATFILLGSNVFANVETRNIEAKPSLTYEQVIEVHETLLFLALTSVEKIKWSLEDNNFEDLYRLVVEASIRIESLMFLEISSDDLFYEYNSFYTFRKSAQLLVLEFKMSDFLDGILNINDFEKEFLETYKNIKSLVNNV